MRKEGTETCERCGNTYHWRFVDPQPFGKLDEVGNLHVQNWTRLDNGDYHIEIKCPYCPIGKPSL